MIHIYKKDLETHSSLRLWKVERQYKQRHVKKRSIESNRMKRLIAKYAVSGVK